MSRARRAGLLTAVGLVLAAVVVVLLVGRSPSDPDRDARAEPTAATSQAPTQAPTQASTQAPLPLAGVRIALDAGHQLGNARFGAQVNRQVEAGGFSKACNSTGTATDDGYPEASLTFAIVESARVRLEALGATVLLTRTENSADSWGPCIDERGRFGARVGADLTLSVHADGAPASARGFHVIAPAARAPWTTDIAAESRRLALALRDGFDAQGLPRAPYVNRGYGVVTRADLGTLNLSDVPVALVEVGNMRNPTDARAMRSVAGRVGYAEAIVAGIRAYLGR